METSHLFCRAKQMTGFYMKCNTGLKWVTGTIKSYSKSLEAAVHSVLEKSCSIKLTGKHGGSSVYFEFDNRAKKEKVGSKNTIACMLV